MRVIEKVNSEVLFEDVEEGEIFKYGDTAFMKIETIDSFSNDTYNAVSLVTGELSLWSNSAEVIRYPDAEVILNP